MKLFSTFVLFTILFNAMHSNTGEIRPPLAGAIDIATGSKHIIRITNDSIVVVDGSTYRFSVDTPEDQGLVSTKPSIAELLKEIVPKDGWSQNYKVVSKNGLLKSEGALEFGDQLIVTEIENKASRRYYIVAHASALSGELRLEENRLTINTDRTITLYYKAGQRSPDVTVKIFFPKGIQASMEQTSVNVIGRGEVALKDLDKQSIGRVGTNYAYSKVGTAIITALADGSSVLTFRHLDLRPANGPDLKIVVRNVRLRQTGSYTFKAVYTTSEPEILSSAGTGHETVTLEATKGIADFQKILNKNLQYIENSVTYNSVEFKWSAANKASSLQLMQSTDQGQNWTPSAVVINPKATSVKIRRLSRNMHYCFRLMVKGGENQGISNTAYFYTGKIDIRDFGVNADGNTDNTDKINLAIDSLHKMGGGTLLFSKGTYCVRTVHLKSNVWLYIDSSAIIQALKGGDAPEITWFSDKKYRSGLSPTDPGPYENPENWLTKQDVGHHYFRNTMFFGERIDNVKIIGNGRITGDGNLTTTDKVMNNAPDRRSDKMFTFKLCTNIEIGGILRQEDLWYDEKKDQPYYIGANALKMTNTGNMLNIDRAGHFAVLATGTDNIFVHDTYFGKYSTSNVRDIYDFMACNNVTVTNIYSKTSSDDVVKPGSDCSLGFTRPARKFRIRNIIGDTNCNLFQIGSETADDISDVCVDNIYVLGANKAGFSISTNDGGHVKDIHLNCGETGAIRVRSKMYRTTTPFFISISNRARILGAKVERFSFTENGQKRNELLVKNVNIGSVENIMINGVDIAEVYAGSSYNGSRWKSYDGKQRKATPIIAGYKLPDPSTVDGGLDFQLPNGQSTGYIKNISFNDIHVLVKGGNLASDTAQLPRELGVGQYNVNNLGVQPSYGLWARHVQGLSVKKSSFRYEQPEGRYALYLDDVQGGVIDSVSVQKPVGHTEMIKCKNSFKIRIKDLSFITAD